MARGPQPGFNLPPYRQYSDSDLTGELSEDQEIQVFAKQMLINRLFLGHYQERRLVEPLKTYRDIVVVNSSEFDLKKDLETVRKRVKDHKSFSNTWIGITGPDVVGAPAGYAIWVKLKDLPFGQYWFQIRQVKFLDRKEMHLRLKCIRPVENPALYERGDFEPVRAAHVSDQEVSSTSTKNSFSTESSVDWNKMRDKFKSGLEEGLFNVLSLMTFHNAKEVICFTAVLLAACITGLFHSLRYIGDFSLRFMREFSHIIRATTPIVLAIIDFCSKCVGGFYVLIAMMWRSPRQGPSRPMPPQFPIYGAPPRAIEMPRKWQRR